MTFAAASVILALNSLGTSPSVSLDQGCKECPDAVVISDLNCDQCVDSADMAILLAAWGTSCHDLNLDGVVDQDDLDILLADWGCY